MARIRSIKPTFFRDHGMAELPLTARLTFIGLWTYVDDAGRGLDDARLVKGDLWSLDDGMTVRKVENDLKTLAERGYIHRYTVGDRDYLEVVNWKKHQRISHPTASTIPPAPEAFANESGDTPEASSLEGNREEGKEEGGADDRSSARALMAPGCAPHLIEEATQNLVSLCDVWPIAQVDAAIQTLIDDRRRFQWPSKLDAALTAILGDPPATAPANVLDDTQRAQMAIAERGLDQVRAAINDPDVAQDPEERKRILAEQRAARGAA